MLELTINERVIINPLGYGVFGYTGQSWSKLVKAPYTLIIIYRDLDLLYTTE